MNNHGTVNQLEGLKLKGMALSYQAMLNLPLQQRPSIEQAVAKLAEAEKNYRRDKRTQMYLKTSKLRYNAVLEEIICSKERNFTKEDLLALSDCSFVPQAQNLLIVGMTGVGKSYLACALGKQACYLGYRTEYLNSKQSAWYRPQNS